MELTCHVMLNKFTDELDDAIEYVGGDTSQIHKLSDYSKVIKNQLIKTGETTYTISKLEQPSFGMVASYQLEQNGKATGEIIDIPKNHVIAICSVKFDNIPYAGAKIGDEYIHLETTPNPTKPIYIPLSTITNIYRGSEWIKLEGLDIKLRYEDLLQSFKTELSNVFAPVDLQERSIFGLKYKEVDLTKIFGTNEIDLSQIFGETLNDDDYGATIGLLKDNFYTKEETDYKYLHKTSYTTNEEIDSILK